jgi:two-component system NtrC family sensor kinase
VENANDVIYSLTPTGDISYLSPKFTDILGYEISEYLGKPFSLLMHPDDVKQSIELFQRGLKTGQGDSGFEFRMKHKEGHQCWFVSNSSVILDQNGNIIEIIGVAHDITEMKKILDDLARANETLRETQAQLVQSEKMASLGSLVAGIAHEINTPIGAVSSMYDTLSRTLDKLKDVIKLRFPKEYKQMPRLKSTFKVIDDSNNVIRSGTERVINIVRRLKSFARLDEAELKTVDIHEGLEDTLTLIHHELKHNIRVIKNFGDIPSIACFPGQLNQVFLNLLINSKQAIKDKGTIRITTFVKDDKVHIVVKDTGVGISKGNLKKVFDPGFTTKGRGVGAGLGLSICYQIIQDHRGEIRVESELGKGATFTIILPMDLEEILEIEKTQA